MLQAKKLNNMSRLSRRAALAGLAGAAAVGAVVPIAAALPVSEVDPIFAAIEDHKKLFDEATRFSMALSEAEEAAEQKHGYRPVPLIHWRNYFIGGTEIDFRRAALLAEPGADSKKIEKEYRAAKASCEARERAGRAWDDRAGVALRREEMECAYRAARAGATHLAMLKPTTPAGTRALIAYVRADRKDYCEEWHEVAIMTAIDALAGMSSIPAA